MKVRIFYLTAFIYSWAVWAAAIFIKPAGISPELIVSIGGAGTVVAVLSTVVFFFNKSEKRAYLNRIIKIKGVPPLMYAALLLPCIVQIAASGFSPSISKEFLESDWFYPIFLFLFGPVPEELAWRGIAFDELSKKSYISAQLIVAGLWGIWHLPMFFIPGSYQNGLGIFTFDFWMFFIEIIPVSIITGYIYLKSGRNILMAMLFHYSINLFGQIFELSSLQHTVRFVIYSILAIMLLFFKPKLNSTEVA